MTLAAPLVRALALTLAAALGCAALAQAAPIAGTFADDRVTLTLRAIGGGQYTGTITVDGATYQLIATGSPERVEGTFTVGGASFAFQAQVAGDVVTLVSGTSRYSLARRPEADAATPAAAASTPQRAIQRGTRLSYDHGAVSHAGFDAGPDVRSVGGRGVTQFTVLHLDDSTCVLSMVMYLQDGEGGPLHLQPFAGGAIVGRDGACPDVWAPPERLATYSPPAGSVEQVERGPFQLPGDAHVFDALYLRLELAGTRSARAYDLASGVVLSATDGTGPVQAPAREPTSSSFLTLRDVRTPTLPWDVYAPLPAQVRSLSGLTARGTVSTAFLIGGAPAYVERIEVTLDVVERLPGLLLLRPRGGSADAYTGLGPYGTLFVPPAAIPSLRPGQRLDEDPIAGSVVSVASNDASALVLAVDGPGLAIRRSFDPATGLIRAERIEINDGITHLVIESVIEALP